jgi:hypothetical protein
MAHRKNSLARLALFALTAAIIGCAPQGGATHAGPVTNEPQPAYLEHTITFSGETLADIAAWYTGRATNWQVIRDANPNLKPNNLKLGQVVLIPRSIVVNEKPFTKNSLKRTPAHAPEASPTPASTENEPVPGPNATPAPETGAQNPAVPAPVATEAPVAPAPAATPASGRSSDDLEREKLLDELLK